MQFNRNITSGPLSHYGISCHQGIITHLDRVDDALVSFTETFAIFPAHLLQQAITNIVCFDALCCRLFKSEHKYTHEEQKLNDGSKIP